MKFYRIAGVLLDDNHLSQKRKIELTKVKQNQLEMQQSQLETKLKQLEKEQRQIELKIKHQSLEHQKKMKVNRNITGATIRAGASNSIIDLTED